MHSTLRAASLCLMAGALGLVTRPASAQSNKTTLHIAAGAALPTGNFGDHADVGYNLTVGLGVTQRGSPLGLRFEGTYNEFNESGSKAHAGGGIANLEYDLSAGSRTMNTLYLIGGLGYYQIREPFFLGSRTRNEIGWNVGGGFRFPLTGFSAYVEARYHTVSNSEVRFVPITFGLMF
jgi:hypothetical protein